MHGGHVNKADDPAKGFDNWRKAIEATDLKLPLLIENTAGGDNAMTRYLDRIEGVWAAISGTEQADRVGFCLDTCHAHAGGNALETVVAEVTAITGRIDLVHCNDSRDEFDSAPTGTPTSAPARSILISWPASSATPAPRWSARRRAPPTPTWPTSPGCASGSESSP